MYDAIETAKKHIWQEKPTRKQIIDALTKAAAPYRQYMSPRLVMLNRPANGEIPRHWFTEDDVIEVEQYYEAKYLKNRMRFMKASAIGLTRQNVKWDAFVAVDEPAFMEIWLVCVSGSPLANAIHKISMSGPNRILTAAEKSHFVSDMKSRAARMDYES